MVEPVASGAAGDAEIGVADAVAGMADADVVTRGADPDVETAQEASTGSTTDAATHPRARCRTAAIPPCSRCRTAGTMLRVCVTEGSSVALMVANRYPEIAFGPAARARQAAVGHTQPHGTGDFGLEGTDKALIRRADHFFLSTVTESGWPYVQHRGGPAGFVHVDGDTTLSWVEFRGNRQYVSTGDIDSDGRVCLFFVDYPTRSRLKVFGNARIVEPDRDPALIERLRTMGEKTYTGHVERAIVVELVASDANCSKHITPRWTREYVDELTGLYRRDIEQLQAQIDDLRGHDHTG